MLEGSVRTIVFVALKYEVFEEEPDISRVESSPPTMPSTRPATIHRQRRRSTAAYWRSTVEEPKASEEPDVVVERVISGGLSGLITRCSRDGIARPGGTGSLL